MNKTSTRSTILFDVALNDAHIEKAVLRAYGPVVPAAVFAGADADGTAVVLDEGIRPGNRVFADEVEIDTACKENWNRLSPNESDPSRVPIGSITPIKWDAYQSSVTINQGSRITVRNSGNETPGQPLLEHS